MVMNGLHEGWFTEFSPLDVLAEEANSVEGSHENGKWPQFPQGMQGWKGQAFSLKVSSVLYHKKSKYQDIMVLESESYGRVLVLDGIIQVTERDEFSYQEMISHLPLFAHSLPKDVLVIGGGDGGVIREVLKHPSVESVVLCEIDEDVINVSKQFLPKLADKMHDSKVRIHIGDGFEFLRQNPGHFDIIITDSSDPIGPAETLFQQPYYELMRDALKPDGILCCQAESIWLHLPLVTSLVNMAKSLFPVVAYAQCSVPTYPSGLIGYLLCSKSQENKLVVPKRTLSANEVASMKLQFYNSEIHSAAFVLPQFAKNQLS